MSWRDTTRPAQPRSWRDTIRPAPSDFTVEPEAKELTAMSYGPNIPVYQSLLAGFGQGVTLDNLGEFLKYASDNGIDLTVMEEENPIAAGIGRFGGYAVPGIAATKILKPATALGRLGIEAGLGGIQGIKEGPEGVATGAALGAAGGSAIEGIRALKPLAKKGLDVFNKVVFSTDPEVTQTLIKNPKYLENVSSVSEVSRAFSNDLNKFSQELKNLSNMAKSKLTNQSFEGKGSILSGFDEMPEKYGVTSVTENYPESQAIIKEIATTRDAINKAKTQSDLKHILGKLDAKADFETPSRDKVNSVRKELRGIIDARLKEQNPAYRQAMEPVAQKSEIIENAIESSGVELKKGNYVPSDTTLQKLETLINDLPKEKRLIAKHALFQVSPELQEKLNKIRISRKAQGGVKSGSRNIAMGFTGGSILEGVNQLFGAPLPSGTAGTLGAVAGTTIDSYGRNIGAGLAKRAPGIKEFLTRYADPAFRAGNQLTVNQILKEIFDKEVSQ